MKEIEVYKHIVQYYETDMMGFVHHSNYIRWMEESRVDYLRQINIDYTRLEVEKYNYKHPQSHDYPEFVVE